MDTLTNNQGWFPAAAYGAGMYTAPDDNFGQQTVTNYQWNPQSSYVDNLKDNLNGMGIQDNLGLLGVIERLKNITGAEQSTLRYQRDWPMRDNEGKSVRADILDKAKKTDSVYLEPGPISKVSYAQESNWPGRKNHGFYTSDNSDILLEKERKPLVQEEQEIWDKESSGHNRNIASNYRNSNHRPNHSTTREMYQGRQSASLSPETRTSEVEEQSRFQHNMSNGRRPNPQRDNSPIFSGQRTDNRHPFLEMYNSRHVPTRRDLIRYSRDDIDRLNRVLQLQNYPQNNHHAMKLMNQR